MPSFDGHNHKPDCYARPHVSFDSDGTEIHISLNHEMETYQFGYQVMTLGQAVDLYHELFDAIIIRMQQNTKEDK